MQHADNFDLFGPYLIKNNVTFNLGFKKSVEKDFNGIPKNILVKILDKISKIYQNNQLPVATT